VDGLRAALLQVLGQGGIEDAGGCLALADSPALKLQLLDAVDQLRVEPHRRRREARLLRRRLGGCLSHPRIRPDTATRRQEFRLDTCSALL